MKMHIKATNFTLTPAVEDLITEKIGGLEKYVPQLEEKGVLECWVEVGKTTKHHQKGDVFRAEADIRLPGKIIRAEAERETLIMAVTEVKDELQQQIKTFKGKFQAKDKRGIEE
jgi:putative sigma-54 modulation protein